MLPIPDCTQTVTLTGLAIAVAYDVYVRHVGTNKTRKIAENTTSDGSGELDIDISEEGWQLDQSYELWVNTTGNTAAFSRADIVQGADTLDCVRFKVTPVIEDGDVEQYATQKFTVET